MYSLLKNIHSYWAYLVLLVLILGILNAIVGKIKGKDFESKDLRLSLFGLIFSPYPTADRTDFIFRFPLV